MQANRENSYLDIAPEVGEALQAGRPVVALESTIICHGMPYPQNAETANAVEATVREHGAVPATIAILAGRLKVGLDASEINELARKGRDIIKCSRRDIPFLVANNEDGATTVAATMILAAMAGIRVFATGGIGGVHRGVESTMDVSADLDELARSNVAVVCAGVKSVLDIGRTLEYLETKGVPVVGYQTDTMPAFYTQSSGFALDYRVDSSIQAAAAIKAKWELRLDGGVVIANPVPEAYALSISEMDRVIDGAIADMNKQGVTGKDTTPFLLGRIAESTDGRSLETNIQLVLNNARVATEIAVELSRIQ